jgi:hypothetical protein
MDETTQIVAGEGENPTAKAWAAPETEQPTPAKAEIMDEDGEAWHEAMREHMANGDRIIAFRGAGSINGIDPADLEKRTTAIEQDLEQWLSENPDRKVVLMFDGDEDNRERPDIGAVFGIIGDKFADNPRVVLRAAQKQSWYYPKTEGGNLETANGTQILTNVFPDSTPGEHSAFTQSDELVNYPNYEQIFVGPVGDIAFGQLKDASDKAHDGRRVKVFLHATKNNSGMDAVIAQNLENARATGDEGKIAKFTDQQRQRADFPYGKFFDKQGRQTIKPSDYPGLDMLEYYED